MTKAVKGVLVECDPSVKSIILKIDAEENAYIVEDLDEKHLVIKETMLAQLKEKLQAHLQATVGRKPGELSDSDDD